MIQEVNPQGGLVWKWRGSDHIDPVKENTYPGMVTVRGEQVYDLYHCNSVEPSPTGDLLVSARHLNAVFEIQRATGKIVWKLGGKPVNKDGAQILAIQNDQHPGGSVMQHDARFLPNGHITLFDNQSFTGAARGVEYALNLANGTATLVAQFPSPLARSSLAMGSFRRLSDGHSVAGWGVNGSTGDAALLTEFDAAGNDVLDMSFGAASYRSPKVPLTMFDRQLLRHTAGSGGWTDTGPSASGLTSLEVLSRL